MRSVVKMCIIVKVLALLVVVVSPSLAEHVTFRDVTLHGYQVFTHKFEVEIHSSGNLKDDIPENAAYDALEVSNASIPFLYENSVTDLEYLDELIFVNDGIKEIQPGAFRNLPLLRKVNLKGNGLQEIVEGVFNGMAISEVNLSDNDLTKIDTDAFNDMPNLMYINLANNKISRWDKNWFAHNPLLTRVSLNHNKITTLPRNAFKNLAGDKQFGSVQLKLYLDFSYNKISSLKPDVFEGLSKVGSLWLDHNELTSIDTTLFENVNIEFLNLNDNKITCLEGDLGNILKASMTNLDGNPWDCACLEDVKDWVKTRDNYVQLSYADMECYAQRIKMKMDSLQKRLDEIKNQ